MQASFSSQTYNISALLGRNSFPSYTAKRVVVPPFQRGYSWELSHVSTFWEDVSSFHKQLSQKGGQDTYFLGPIVILPSSDCVNLLDGQQRLTTFYLVLKGNYIIRNKPYELYYFCCGGCKTKFEQEPEKYLILK